MLNRFHEPRTRPLREGTQGLSIHVHPSLLVRTFSISLPITLQVVRLKLSHRSWRNFKSPSLLQRIMVSSWDIHTLNPRIYAVLHCHMSLKHNMEAGYLGATSRSSKYMTDLGKGNRSCEIINMVVDQPILTVGFRWTWTWTCVSDFIPVRGQCACS